MPTPSLSATSPLGMVPSAPVGGTGIPFGATEIASPGVSPAPLPRPASSAAPCVRPSVRHRQRCLDRRPPLTAAAWMSAPSHRRARCPRCRECRLSNVVIRHSADIGPDRHFGHPKHVRRRLGQSCCVIDADRHRRRRAACRAPAFRWVRRRSAISGSAPPRRCRPSPSTHHSTIAPTIPTVPAVTLPAANTTTVAAPTDAITGIPNIAGTPNTVPGLSTSNIMFR